MASYCNKFESVEVWTIALYKKVVQLCLVNMTYNLNDQYSERQYFNSFLGIKRSIK